VGDDAGDDVSAADLAIVVIWLGLTAYVVLAGADFGGGWWDMLAGKGERGRAVRDLIDRSMAPVWEANHVWLIFVIVMLWTLFSTVFGAVMSTLYIPLTAAALGIIGRGAAYSFRHVARKPWQRRALSATFAVSSVVTPFFLGAAAGGIASGRVPPGIAAGDLVSSWWNPTSIVTGLLAVAVAAYLAAVYLTHDAERDGRDDLAASFRLRALVTGLVVGVLVLVGLPVIEHQSPRLWDQMSSGRALPVVVLSFFAGIVSMLLLVLRAYISVRLAAALAVASVVWAWGLGQYPEILPGTAVADAAAPDNVIATTLVSLAVGAILLVPALWWLYSLAQRGSARSEP
jgi:cytochrome d ubiquinol oxidase subunit II